MSCVAGPDRRHPRHVIELAAVVDAAGRLVVVAADHRVGLERLHAIDDRVGLRAVADEIPQHQHAIPRGPTRARARRRRRRCWRGCRRGSDTASISRPSPRRGSARRSPPAGPSRRRARRARAYAACRSAKSRSIWARSADSGRRPSGGSRAITDSSGTSSHTDAPSSLIAISFSGSMKVPPPVATTVCRSGRTRRSRISRSAARK